MGVTTALEPCLIHQTPPASFLKYTLDLLKFFQVIVDDERHSGIALDAKN
jgi:hypothetical protein